MSRPQLGHGLCDRRAFLGVCVAGSAAQMLTSCAALMVRAVPLVNGRIALAFSQYPELSEPGGSLRVLPTGWPNPLYILAQGNGAFTALSPICTHLGCTVEIQGAQLVCPCHGSMYDRQGAVVRGPAERALARYPAARTEDGSALVVTLESPIRQDRP